jgi:NADH dehydrogenase
VIVGAGFGGLEAAQTLVREHVDVVVVDRRNHHLFQPLLYQVATAALSPADIAAPIRKVLRGSPNLRVVLGEVTGIDLARRVVVVDGADLPFDRWCSPSAPRTGTSAIPSGSASPPV